MLAEQRYVIQAPRQRVWDLLAGTIVQCLPAEALQVVNDTTFAGVLNIDIGPLPLRLALRICAEAISPIDSLTTLVTVSKGRLRSAFRVSFRLEDSGESTVVSCSASEAGGGMPMRLLKHQQRRFSAGIFQSIKEGLERSC